jgi:homogentisate 1,2-dioxygenase
VPYYRRVGEVPAKRHTRAASDDGAWLAEELMGTAGFAGASSLLYHRHSPSAIEGAEVVADDRPACSPDLPLLPRHLRTTDLAIGGDPVRDRHLLLANADVTISIVHADRSSGLFRDAVGDELVFVQEGSATLETSFGPLPVDPGSYVVVPMSTVHRWQLTTPRLDLLVLEATGHVAPPRRYLTDHGQFREGAPYCERDLHAPQELPPPEAGPVEVLVRHRGGLTNYCQSHHPFDIVGWDGTVYPYRFSIHDFEPIVGAVHQPPPVHQTFEGPGFAVCSFVPRPFDFGRDAAKVPYHHANVDCDEVLFYAAGDFMSRAGSGIGVGSMSFHPAGFVHGPQPGSVEAALDQARTEELAVMVDTFRPLDVSDVARSISAPEYPWTWGRRP